MYEAVCVIIDSIRICKLIYICMDLNIGFDFEMLSFSLVYSNMYINNKEKEFYSMKRTCIFCLRHYKTNLLFILNIQYNKLS